MARRRSDSLWKFLIIVNLALSIVGLWFVYSQNVYISELLNGHVQKLENTPTTAVVVNPFSGYFIAAYSQTVLGVIIFTIAVVCIAAYVFSRRNN